MSLFPYPTVYTLFRIAIFRLFDDGALPLAGNIAYRTLLAVFPFLIFLTTIGGFFHSPQLAQAIVDFFLSTAPSYVVNPISEELHAVLSVPRRGLFTLSVVITLWSAMGGIDSVRVCLNRAYDLKETRSSWTLYGLSCCMVLAAVTALLLIAFLSVLSPIALAQVEEVWSGFSALDHHVGGMRYPLSLLLLCVVLGVFHLYLPAGRRTLRDVWPGVIFTVLAWTAMTVVYGYYLTFFPTFTLIYAGLGGIVAALFFLYLAAILLILGGEINRVLMLERETASLLEIAIRRQEGYRREYDEG